MSLSTNPASATNPAAAAIPAAAAVVITRVYPRITITYCTQCKWMLRAAYNAQELLSTFSSSLAEVALRPGTGGVYTVDIEAETAEIAEIATDDRGVSGESQGESEGQGRAVSEDMVEGKGAGDVTIRTVRLWDRKIEGGFPETKILKRLVRNVIDPGRGLGHVDRGTVDAIDAVDAGVIAGTTSGIVGDAPARSGNVESRDVSVAATTVTPTNGLVIAKKDAVIASEAKSVLDGDATAARGKVNSISGHAGQIDLQTTGKKDVDDEDQCDCARP